MNQNLTITEEGQDPEFNEKMKRFRRNGEWLTANGATFFERFPGKYIAVSEGDVFVAEHASEARRLAGEKHPGDEAFVQFM